MLYKPSIAALLFTILLSSCISYRKRPARLFTEVIASQSTYDAGIVPGVPFTGQWDSVMKGRVLWAAFLYDKGIIRNLIFSGGAVYSPYYEARIMGLYAEQLGVKTENIFYETRAEHSTENVYYSYEMARTLGFKSIALVTDPFQSSMLKGFTNRRFATGIQHIPFLTDSLKLVNHTNPAIDPTGAFVADFKSLPARQSWLRRFRGTLGNFIPWENKLGRKASPL